MPCPTSARDWALEVLAALVLGVTCAYLTKLLAEALP